MESVFFFFVQGCCEIPVYEIIVFLVNNLEDGNGGHKIGRLL